MAGKIVIEIFREKKLEDFTKLLADPGCKLEIGSGIAAQCALSASLLCRAASMTAEAGVSGEKMEYLIKNTETLRAYMVYLVDEDVKCRGPLRKASKTGEPKEMEATRRTAVAIAEELVNMTRQGLTLANELADICTEDAKTYIESYGYGAMAACKEAISYILSMSGKSFDENYRFVTRRENEMTMEQYTELYDSLMAKIK